VETSLREADFATRMRSGLTQRTQDMTERAIRRADERIQAVLRRLEGKRPQYTGGGVPVPPEAPITPIPASPPPAAAGKSQEPVTDDERLMILQMVENKKITVDEAEALLEALENQNWE